MRTGWESTFPSSSYCFRFLWAKITVSKGWRTSASRPLQLSEGLSARNAPQGQKATLELCTEARRGKAKMALSLKPSSCEWQPLWAVCDFQLRKMKWQRANHALRTPLSSERCCSQAGRSQPFSHFCMTSSPERFHPILCSVPRTINGLSHQ